MEWIYLIAKFGLGITILAEVWILTCQFGHVFFYGRLPQPMMNAALWARLEASHSYRKSRERLDDTAAVVRRLGYWCVVMFIIINTAPDWVSFWMALAIGLLEINMIMAAHSTRKFECTEIEYSRR